VLPWDLDEMPPACPAPSAPVSQDSRRNRRRGLAATLTSALFDSRLTRQNWFFFAATVQLENASMFIIRPLIARSRAV
jgi:hypothetical protein